MNNVKICVHSPLEDADKIRKTIGDFGAGIIGNYSHCSFATRGVGRFKPNDNANPTIGESGKIEEVEEENIEFICPTSMAKEVIKKIKEAHPYEEPAIEILPIIEEEDLQ